MTLKEQVFAQAALLAGQLEGNRLEMLDVLCTASVASLSARLRQGLTPEDCKADFVAAASLFAVAAMSELDEVSQMEQITAGDLTMRRKSTDAAGCCLRYQAELLMMPYMCDPFAFVGV